MTTFPTHSLVGDACAPAGRAARVGVGLPVRRPGLGVVGGRGTVLRLRLPHQPPPDAVPSCAVAASSARCARASGRSTWRPKRSAGHRHRRAAGRAAAGARRAAPDLGRPASGGRSRMPGVRLRRGPQPTARVGHRHPVRRRRGRRGEPGDPPQRRGLGPARDLLDSGEVDGRRAVLLDVREAGEQAVSGPAGGRVAAGRRGPFRRRGGRPAAGHPAACTAEPGFAPARRWTCCARGGSTR